MSRGTRLRNQSVIFRVDGRAAIADKPLQMKPCLEAGFFRDAPLAVVYRGNVPSGKGGGL